MARLVDRLDGQTAVALICPSCNWHGRDEDPASGEVSAGVTPCPRCGEAVEYEYDEGERCGGCRVLARELPVTDEHGSYCSRVCLLQAEYARELEARRAS